MSRSLPLVTADEHLRMEYLVAAPPCSPYGLPKGPRDQENGPPDCESARSSWIIRESRARHLSWIKTAAEGKAGRGRYGTSYELLIAVEDWWFGPTIDTEEVVTFIET